MKRDAGTMGRCSVSESGDTKESARYGRGFWTGARAAFLLVVPLFTLGVNSCQQPVLGPGEVGTTTCLACHDGRSAPDRREFLQSPHRALSCESCHGPGLSHVQRGGRLGLFINNPGRLPFDTRHTACTDCHADVTAPGGHTTEGFLASTHFTAGGATCTDCHDVHKMGGMAVSVPSPSQLSNDDYAAICGRCHEGQVDQFALSTHAKEDAATCSSCHDMHTGEMFRASPEDNRLCLQCHQSFFLGFETDEDTDFHTGVFHPVDPAGTGSSRCTGCHLPPLPAMGAEPAAHDHTLFTIPPIATNEAVEQGANPAPPSSCAGVTGCHDPAVPGSGMPHDEGDLNSNENLQILYELIGAQP